MLYSHQAKRYVSLLVLPPRMECNKKTNKVMDEEILLLLFYYFLLLLFYYFFLYSFVLYLSNN